MSFSASPGSRRWLRALIMLPTMGAVAYFVLWACAPPATLAPPLPMADGHSAEVGIGVTGGYRLDSECDGIDACGTINGQLWGYYEFKNRLGLGGAVFAGNTSLFGGGAMLRYTFLHRPTLRLGAEVQGGWLWGGVSFPAAVMLADDVWLYTAPSVAYRATGILRLPVGLTFRTGEDFTVSLELGTDMVEPYIAWGYNASYFPYLGLTSAYRF